jgi:hypothetical protein
MAKNALMRRSGRSITPSLKKAQSLIESKSKSLAKARDKVAVYRKAAESKAMHLFRAGSVQAGAFAAGLASLEDGEHERLVFGAPAPVALGLGLTAAGMLMPGESVAAHGLVSAGAGSIAGWSYSKGQEVFLSWSEGLEEPSEVDET